MSKAQEILLHTVFSESGNDLEINWASIAKKCQGDDKLFIAIMRVLEKSCDEFSTVMYQTFDATFHAAYNGMMTAAVDMLVRELDKEEARDLDYSEPWLRSVERHISYQHPDNQPDEYMAGLGIARAVMEKCQLERAAKKLKSSNIPKRLRTTTI